MRPLSSRTRPLGVGSPQRRSILRALAPWHEHGQPTERGRRRQVRLARPQGDRARRQHEPSRIALGIAPLVCRSRMRDMAPHVLERVHQPAQPWTLTEKGHEPSASAEMSAPARNLATRRPMLR